MGGRCTKQRPGLHSFPTTIENEANHLEKQSIASWAGLAVTSYAAKCWQTATTQAISFKEVIQPQVPLRLPCYDFVPVMDHTVVTVLLPPKKKVRLATSGAIHSHDVTGGVYKARERIHRDVLIRDY